MTYVPVTIELTNGDINYFLVSFYKTSNGHIRVNTGGAGSFYKMDIDDPLVVATPKVTTYK